jgi:putative hydroxymethylpyrimidine transport system substrate-binding protein
MKKIVFSFLLLLCLPMIGFSKPLTLILDWFVNLTHGPILISEQKGFFNKHGLQVKIISPADPTDTTKLVAIGKADIGISSDPELILLIKQGLPLVRIGALINQPLDALTVRTDRHVKTLQQIKGKTVGYPVGGIDKILLSLMLHHVGLSLNDVHLVDVHFNLVEALLSGQVDAIAGAMRDYEVPQLRLHGLQVHTFYPEDYGIPKYAELNYITNTKMQHSPKLNQFFKSIQQATRYIKHHPKKSWRIIIKAYPQLNTSLNRRSWFMTYPRFPNKPRYTNKKHFMQLVQLMHRYHWINQALPYSAYVS